MSKFTRTGSLLAGLAAMTLLGCGYSPGGQGVSKDLFTYESTPDFPQNISVIDWTTNESLLTVEVPVGQQLVLRFFEDYNKDNAARPALMRWKLMRVGTEFGELDNTMPVPPATHRRIDVHLRDRAEAIPKPIPAPEAVSPK